MGNRAETHVLHRALSQIYPPSQVSPLGPLKAALTKEGCVFPGEGVSGYPFPHRYLSQPHRAREKVLSGEGKGL